MKLEESNISVLCYNSLIKAIENCSEETQQEIAEEIEKIF